MTKAAIRIPNIAARSRLLPLTDNVLLGWTATAVTGAAAMADLAPQNAPDLAGAITATFCALYATGSAVDFIQRKRTRKINLLSEFGADVKHHEDVPNEVRAEDLAGLVEQANDMYVPQGYRLKELASAVNQNLTKYIARVTGQQVTSSSRVGRFGLAKFIMPFAIRAADPFSGDIRLYRRMGVFEPHVLGHEFLHRKGYGKEFDAQIIAYLAGLSSGDRVLVQSALCERLSREFSALNADSREGRAQLVADSGLRAELKRDFLLMLSPPGLYQRMVTKAILPLYDLRMRLTGQNGIRDYSRGFTNMVRHLEATGQHPAIA